MKKIKEFLSRPAVTAVLFVLAVALLAGSSVTGALAVLNKYSKDYEAEMKTTGIGIALMEYDPILPASLAVPSAETVSVTSAVFAVA